LLHWLCRCFRGTCVGLGSPKAASAGPVLVLITDVMVSPPPPTPKAVAGSNVIADAQHSKFGARATVHAGRYLPRSVGTS
jgi:hypothetical protein